MVADYIAFLLFFFFFNPLFVCLFFHSPGESLVTVSLKGWEKKKQPTASGRLLWSHLGKLVMRTWKKNRDFCNVTLCCRLR